MGELHVNPFVAALRLSGQPAGLDVAVGHERDAVGLRRGVQRQLARVDRADIGNRRRSRRRFDEPPRRDARPPPLLGDLIRRLVDTGHDPLHIGGLRERRVVHEHVAHADCAQAANDVGDAILLEQRRRRPAEQLLQL